MIGYIRWPQDRLEAVKLNIRFKLLVLAKLGIKIVPTANDAMALAQGTLDGTTSHDERVEAADQWWAMIMDGKFPRLPDGSMNPERLNASLALSIISVFEENYEEFEDDITYFFDTLHEIGADDTKAVEMMKVFFEFNSNI